MIRLLPALLLLGCAEIKAPSPVVLPSVCMGDENCEARKNAETLAAMGFHDAGLRVMCDDADVRDILEVECEPNALPYP